MAVPVSWFCSISFTIGSSNPICCIIVTFLILYFFDVLEDLLRVLQFGGWVHGPAPHHPGEKLTHAIKPRQRLKKKDGLSNKRLYILLTLTVFVNIINVSTTHKIMNKPTRNKHPLFKIADDAPVHLPTPSTIRGWRNFGSLLEICLVTQIAIRLFLAPLVRKGGWMNPRNNMKVLEKRDFYRRWYPEPSYIYCAVWNVWRRPPTSNRRYLHLDEGTLYRVMGLACLEYPQCYAGDSLATGRVSLAGQDEGERWDEERYPGPPCWGLRCWISIPTLAKNVLQLKKHTPKPETSSVLNLTISFNSLLIVTLLCS